MGYQVFGNGSRSIVFITNWLTNVEVIWEEPAARRYLERLGTFGRVVFIDKRGTGVSDHHGTGRALPVEEHLDDVMAVLDKVEFEEAVLIGDVEGGTLALVLAALHPDRFTDLILINSFTRIRRDDDYPIGAPDEVLESLAKQWKDNYGHSTAPLRLVAPSMAEDRRFGESWLRQNRLSMPPGTGGEALTWIANTDVRGVLPSVQARTLVLNRKDARFHRAAYGQFIAERLDATYVEMTGADTLPFYAGDFGPILDEIQEFLTGDRQQIDSDRMLATVLFTDIVGSTAMAADVGEDRWLDLLAAHKDTVTSIVEQHRGRLIKSTGDGILAIFDGPQRAILCAIELLEGLQNMGVPIRAGLHTGEVELRDGDVAGLAVHIASRVMDVAESGGIMVSRTVKDLVAGSALEFEACGRFELKGVPDEWDLFEVSFPG